MKFTWARAVRWLGLGLLCTLIPLGVGLLGPLPAPRGFWLEFGVALGFVGMGMMVLQFVTSGRLAWIAPNFGTDVVLQCHRWTGILAIGLVLAHPVIILITNPGYLSYFDPRENFLRAAALSFATVALIALLVTSQWREPVGLSYEWWRVAHGVLALGVVFVGMVHGIQVGHYLDTLAQQALWVALLLATLYLVVHTRVVRPWLAKKRPYRIVEVDTQLGDATSLWLEPEDHPGMVYRAGQFIWISIGDSPFQLQQHPFSFSSSEDPKRIRLTAAALGDFTNSWPQIAPGTRAWLEGPFGAFTLEPESKGMVFVVGGIGVTPAMSILHTMAAQGDTRPVYLFYGNPTWEEITFRAELEQLADKLNLHVIHVLEKPPADWDGPEGYVDQEMLDKHLPAARAEYAYYICGPTPLMDVTEQSLRALGIRWELIYTERFAIV